MPVAANTTIEKLLSRRLLMSRILWLTRWLGAVDVQWLHIGEFVLFASDSCQMTDRQRMTKSTVVSDSYVSVHYMSRPND